MSPVKRPLRAAEMLAISERRRWGPLPFAPGAQESGGAASKANRIDALTKLASLLDLGVLTQEQHDSEFARLMEGDVGEEVAPGRLGPVQLLVLPFVEGVFDLRVLEELRRLRERDGIGVLDLLFVVKDELGDVARLQQSDLTVQEAATFGGLVAALFYLGAEVEELGVTDRGAGAGALAVENGSLRAGAKTWFLGDMIPAGEAAAIVLVEHRWAVPLSEAIKVAGGRDLVDRWLHPEDLVAIGADGT
jgi:uncharacterized membrane protein